MSQITRCPQCQTRFKVVDDQLRISDGWVRCGKCKSVFDALTHLVQRPDSPAAASSPSAGAAPAAPVPTAPVATTPSQSAAAPPTLEAPAPSTPAVAPVPVAPASASLPVKPPAAANPAPAPVSAPAAVVVTGNSIPVDQHANVPELSVLVFPRRGGFGDSGYVDSSWMSAYENEPEVSKQAPAVVAPPVDVEAVKASAEVEDKRTGLESDWHDSIDHRPEAVRNSTADFSAKDELAELKAREDRLLEAIAERKAKAANVAEAAKDANAVLQPAPAPQTDEGVLPKAEAIEAVAPAPSALSAPKIEVAESKSVEPIKASDAPSAAPDALLVAPENAGRQLEFGKVEPALEAPRNYVAEMDEAAAEAAPAADLAADEPSFVRAAKRKAFWAQSWVLVVSLLCAVLLLAGLLLQVLVTQRDRLAVLHPEWRPALEKVCQVAGCQVALPRHLQSVAIDSTTFNPIGQRQFKLTVVLRNKADYAVAMPSLELSLNDAAEKLVLRRVLSPADMKAPPSLSSHGEWTAVVAIKVADNGDDVVGYRVLAFYP